MPADNVYGTLINADVVALSNGMVVRLSGNVQCVRALADSTPHVQGLAGVNNSGTIGVGGPVNVVCAAVKQKVLLETGLTPVAGQTLYVSATIAGRATNVAPGLAVAIGTIEDVGSYSLDSRVFAEISVSASVSAGSGAQGAQGAQGISGAINIASWSITGARVFALDGVNGDDANLGYADSADTTQANVALATQAAGLVAKKTWTALVAIVPPIGNNRTGYAVINNANAAVGATTTYTDRFDALAIANGYAIFATRATGTNATAGCIAFDGSTADLTYQGGVTATGMNATGYTINTGATGDTFALTKVGGGSPAFPAETAKPYFVRVRFDNATTTSALRNTAYPVVEVVDSQTIRFGKTLTLATGDVVYLEDQGVVFSSTATQAFNQTNTTFAIYGIRFGGSLSFTRANATLVWVQTPAANSISMVDGALSIVAQSAVFTGAPNGTSQGSIGPTRTGSLTVTRSNAAIGIRFSNNAFVGGALGTTGNITLVTSPNFSIGSWDTAGGDLLVNGGGGAQSPFASTIGVGIATPGIVGGASVGTSGAEAPTRVIGSMLISGGARVTLGSIKLPSTTQAYGIRIVGTNDVWQIDKIYGGVKTDAGIDMSQSRNSRITYVDGTSSLGLLLTGANGDVFFGQSNVVGVGGIYANVEDMHFASDSLRLPNGDVWTRSFQTADNTGITTTGTFGGSTATFVGNSSGSPIIGQRIIRSGGIGDANTIVPIKADSAATIDGAIGFLVSTIPNLKGGVAIYAGVVPAPWDFAPLPGAAGVAVWVSATGTGQVTNVKPTSPNIVRQVGWSVGESLVVLTPDNQAS